MFTEKGGEKLLELVLAIGDGDVFDTFDLPMPLPHGKCGAKSVSTVSVVKDHIYIVNGGPGTSHSWNGMKFNSFF
jgi:hypothetical protein